MSVFSYAFVIDRLLNVGGDFLPASEKMIDNTQEVLKFIKDNEKIIQQIDAGNIAQQLKTDCSNLVRNIEQLDNSFDDFKRDLLTSKNSIESNRGD